MELWHLTDDTPRRPDKPSPSQSIELWIGTWPVEPGQSVWVDLQTKNAKGVLKEKRVAAVWQHNEGTNSYWRADLGPFVDGDTVTYEVCGRSASGEAKTSKNSFKVGPKIHLALMWHHHQPLYLERDQKEEHYRFPWVRFHAIRDYYPMAALVAQYPNVHLTINLVPSLISQIEGYVERRAVDRALDLTRKPADKLTTEEREEILSTFFEASWHNQIYLYPHYRELFERRLSGKPFSMQDLADLQMWFNLAWFAPEFLDGIVQLHDGTRVDVHRFVQKGKDFTASEIKSMVEAQYAIMRNVVPIHRALQEAGQIEVSTTPFYHPILPLLHDTNVATIDRPGTGLPKRFQAPEDAQAQVNRAVDFYQKRFLRKPVGMWPAEGAVGQSIIDYFVRAGMKWIASDQGVLEKSGQYGYRVDDPNVLCQPYRSEGQKGGVSIFFRDHRLSDAIGFKYQSYPDQEQAAREFVTDLKTRLAGKVSDPANRVVTVILDGENAWSSYPKSGRPFLHALYKTLGEDPEIKTVTFGEYLDGNSARALSAHAVESQEKVFNLFTASWIDEQGSAPGVDLGTWIGESEENAAWDLLRSVREKLIATKGTPASQADAYEALYAAEGSDWFWWFGDDQESGFDDVFDDLFRGHLREVYRVLGKKPPVKLATHIVPHTVSWTFSNPVQSIQPSDRLTIRTNCAGHLEWTVDGWKTHQDTPLLKAGGVMAGINSHSVILGPFLKDVTALDFIFRCSECECRGRELCCGAQPQRVAVTLPAEPQRKKRVASAALLALFVVSLSSIFLLNGCALSAAKNRPIAERPSGFIADENYRDWVRQSGHYAVEMKMSPVLPRVSEDVTIEFIVKNISAQTPEPVSEALMACTARMPNVSGHIHVLESHVHHPETTPGHYQMHPISFGMGGRWDVLLQLKAPDGYEFYSVFPFNVEGPPWPKNYLPEKDRQALDQQESIKKRLEDSTNAPPLKKTLPVWR